MFQAKCVCFYKLGYTEIGPHAKLKCTSQGMFGVPARFTFIFSVCITLCTSLAGLVTPYMGFCLRGGASHAAFIRQTCRQPTRRSH